MTEIDQIDMAVFGRRQKEFAAIRQGQAGSQKAEPQNVSPQGQ
jgi:hypothetical protein